MSNLPIHYVSKLDIFHYVGFSGRVASDRSVFESTCHRVENNGGPRKFFKNQSGNSILLGTGASPLVSGNSILHTNTVIVI